MAEKGLYMIGTIFRFLLLLLIKLITRIFYHFEIEWISGKLKSYKDQKVFLLINHTSLFEPIFIGAFPIPLLWEISRRFAYPIAQKTLNRPIAGFTFKLLSPITLPLTKNRDKAWRNFMRVITSGKYLIGFAPEGRMRRANGLDKDGKPMSMMGGVVDILEHTKSGNILFLFSGGLHHVQIPGEGAPNLFKKIHLALDSKPIEEYISEVQAKYGSEDLRKGILADLEHRRDTLCPKFNDERKPILIRFCIQLVKMW